MTLQELIIASWVTDTTEFVRVDRIHTERVFKTSRRSGHYTGPYSLGFVHISPGWVRATNSNVAIQLKTGTMLVPASGITMPVWAIEELEELVVQGHGPKTRRYFMESQVKLMQTSEGSFYAGCNDKMVEFMPLRDHWTNEYDVSPDIAHAFADMGDRQEIRSVIDPKYWALVDKIYATVGAKGSKNTLPRGFTEHGQWVWHSNNISVIVAPLIMNRLGYTPTPTRL